MRQTARLPRMRRGAERTSGVATQATAFFSTDYTDFMDDTDGGRVLWTRHKVKAVAGRETIRVIHFIRVIRGKISRFFPRDWNSMRRQ